MGIGDELPPRQTEEQLLLEVDVARQEFFESLAGFNAVIADIPSHLPAPDGVQRIRNVARQRDIAYAKYRAALKRLSDHLGSDAPKGFSESSGSGPT
jgi:hypothetical protein